MKRKLYTEWAYILSIVLLALGTACMEKSDFGVSMVVAPAYLMHLKVSQQFAFFTFGMSEYLLQGVLLIITGLCMRRFKLSYLFSFVTAVFYGFTLDFFIGLVAPLSAQSFLTRALFYVVGMLLSTAGVSMMFHTYISGEAYEVFVMELSRKFKVDIHVFKTGFDIALCVIAVALSFLFFGFGHFEGIKWGTVLCTLVNGYLIGRYSKLFDKLFAFEDGLKLRKYFEK